jgi:hypothetical protein
VLALLLEREQRLSRLDLVAAMHVELLQLPGIGRGELHELAFDVAPCQESFAGFHIPPARGDQRGEESPHLRPLQ